MILRKNSWLILIIPFMLNYITMKEENILGSIVAQDYRNGELIGAPTLGVDGLLFIQLFFITIMAYILLGLHVVYQRYCKRVLIKNQAKSSVKSIWQGILLGFFWFLNIKCLSQVKLTHQSTILVMLFKNFNLIPALLLIHYGFRRNSYSKNNKQKIKTEVQDQSQKYRLFSNQNKFFSGFKLFLLTIMLSSVTANLCLQDFVNLILPQDYPSVEVIISTFLNGSFLIANFAEIVVFGMIFWIKRRQWDEINCLKLMIKITKFSSIFFGISSFMNGQFSSVFTELISYNKLVESITVLSLIKFTIYLIICYVIINYPPIIFFALYSTRRTFHKAQEYMIDNIQLRSIPFFISFVVLILLILQYLTFSWAKDSRNSIDEKPQFEMMSQQPPQQMMNLSSIKLQKDDF